MIKLVYKTGLVLSAGSVWYFMYLAKQEEYDVNFGLAINAFLISLFSTIVICILWFKKRGVVKENKVLTVLYLVTSSPFSLFLFIEFYGRFIGQYFKL